VTRILVTYETDTGEVLNRDGSVAGKVVPTTIQAPMIMAYESCVLSTMWPAMLAASRVDLSGAEVKLPDEMREIGRDFEGEWRSDFARGFNAAIQSILDQMPKDNL
jgi:hypothetical protein